MRYVIALILLSCSLAANAAQKPNIVLICLDDHAVQAIGALGSKINQTLHIDRLAKQGGDLSEFVLREFSLRPVGGMKSTKNTNF